MSDKQLTILIILSIVLVCGLAFQYIELPEE
jgi:hypothetical protein